MRFKHMQYRTGKFLTDNSPTILTTLGVVGLVGTAYLTGKASFRAADLIQDRYDEEIDRYGSAQRALEEEALPLLPRERIDLCWKLYVPALVTGSLSVMAIIGANRIGSRRAAAVTAAYAISERAYDEYRNKVVETIGEKKEKKLREELAQDRIASHPLGDQQAIDTGGGKDLCYDMRNGRYFWSSMETIKQAQNRVNYKINHHFYASLSDFYDWLCLDKTHDSNEMGWGQSEQLELTFTTTVSDRGQPVLVMDFLVHPTRGYERVYD